VGGRPCPTDVRHGPVLLHHRPRAPKPGPAAHLPGMSTFEPPQHPRHRSGQFTVAARTEPQLELGPQVWDADVHDPLVIDSWTRAGTGDVEFNRRVRILLGVRDARRKVTVTMAGGTDDLYGSGSTLEDWTDITVSCAGQSLQFADLPALLRHLEHAESPTVDEARVGPMIGHRVRLHTKAGPVLTGQVGNANAMQLYFTGDQTVRHLDLEWDGGLRARAEAAPTWNKPDLRRSVAGSVTGHRWLAGQERTPIAAIADVRVSFHAVGCWHGSGG
jgi:hypothetical protein